MSELRADVLAIGSLARNRLWNETSPVREEYSTVTLVRSGDAVIVVDPGWPADVVKAALFYRAGLAPDAVTAVFLTHLDPAHLRGLGLFGGVPWLVHEEEIRYAEAELAEAMGEVLGRLKPAPDHLAPGVGLFPTPGPTPGHASILVAAPTETLILAGDLVLTRDHFERGDPGEAPWDLERTRESFGEVAEIADLLIPGHDNLFVRRTGTRWL